MTSLRPGSPLNSRDLTSDPARALDLEHVQGFPREVTTQLRVYCTKMLQHDEGSRCDMQDAVADLAEVGFARTPAVSDP